eukprot:Phypoly_transcript_12752.p1 GENE.Phypoly_transcript_12752~~Phypoly_transcript_12752.p1  ORF type:complete len:110 (+),score=12.11 Phypoly_transcript_12752:508-837(+)
MHVGLIGICSGNLRPVQGNNYYPELFKVGYSGQDITQTSYLYVFILLNFIFIPPSSAKKFRSIQGNNYYPDVFKDISYLYVFILFYFSYVILVSEKEFPFFIFKPNLFD